MCQPNKPLQEVPVFLKHDAVAHRPLNSLLSMPVNPPLDPPLTVNSTYSIFILFTELHFYYNEL